MSSDITIYPYNILETGTVAVTGDPDAGYPEARLYDRSTNLYWKDTVTEAKVFAVDQSASALAVDLLVIEGHNFDTEDMQWQYSTTGAYAGEEVDAVTDWAQSGNAQIIKTLGTAQTKSYWRVTLSSMANPRATELWMGFGYKFDVMINPSGGRTSNTQWNRTVGGNERGTKFGELRKFRNYTVFLSAVNLASLRACLDYTDAFSKPFYIRDHEDGYYLARLLSDPTESFDNPTHTHVDLSFVEVI